MLKEHLIQIDKNLCIGCGQCIKDCPANNIALINKKAHIKQQQCIKCGHCTAICPKKAVSMTGFNEPPIEFKEKTTVDSHQLMQALKTRRTIRQFKDQPISDEVIHQIIEAGRLTPTGSNAQDVSYIVLKDNLKDFERIAVRLFRRLLPVIKLINKTAREVPIDDDFFFKKAPAVILVISKSQINGALAASNMALMAESHGLGVLYSGFFAMAVKYSSKLRKQLQLKHGKVITALVLGYPNVKYHRTAQKEEATIHYF
ncbi:MAG: nitroreductase family protein [Beduini sp.]|uniref:nitroreductase family protein n=1 Tax=Beduini sp. TaxID=1922300 RepID=UPI0011C95840